MKKFKAKDITKELFPPPTFYIFVRARYILSNFYAKHSEKCLNLDRDESAAQPNNQFFV